MTRWRLSRAEARGLARRDVRARGEGVAKLAEVEEDLRRDMVEELHALVRRYSGDPGQTRELLEGIVVAETEGVTSEDLAEVLGELREKLDQTAA